MKSFSAELKIIGVNPYVDVPLDILESIFLKAGRSKGPIPVCGMVNGLRYTQTLVRYAGQWRLYINTTMLKDSPRHVGEVLTVSVSYDPTDRALPLHPRLGSALAQEPIAFSAFQALSPSRRHEINRYICALKTQDKQDENICRAIEHLKGNGRFVGREASHPITKAPDNKSRE